MKYCTLQAINIGSETLDSYRVVLLQDQVTQ